MKEEPSYYAIIPANVRYDNDLTPNAKLLYGEITALCNKHGYCWSSNEYFSDLYRVSKVSISKWVNSLIKGGYLAVEITYKKGTKEIDKRCLRISTTPLKEIFNTPTNESLTPHKEIFNTPLKEKFKDNNTSITNNTLNSFSTNSNELAGAEEIEVVSDSVKAKKAKKKSPPVAGDPPPNNYVLLMAIYWDWFKNNNDQVEPKIDGAEGKGLKALQKYFESLANSKIKAEGLEPNPQLVSEKVCDIFNYIFANWTRLENFLQKQVKLAQINSNITNIINNLKNGRKTQSTQQAKNDRVGTVVAGFAAIEDAFRK